MSRTPVVEIPVDDSEFKKFAAAFDDYQDKLKETPAQWQAANAQIAQMARLQQTVGVSADKAWANATKAAGDYQKAVQGAAKAQSGLGATITSAASAMRSMGEASKAVSSNLFSAVRWAVKLGTFGLGGSLFGLGAGLFGLDRLSDTVLSTQRSAAGLGLTSGQLNSYRINMARFAGPNVLQGAANAQINPQQWGYLAALGINPQQAQGEDAATLAGQEALAVRRAWQRNPTLLSAQAQSALQLGFSPEDIRNIGTANGGELRAAITATGQDANQLGWSAQVAKDWVAFSIQLRKAGQLIETTFIETLTPLTPQLTRLSGEVADFIANLGHSDQVKGWISDLATGIKEFTAWIVSPDAKKDFQAFMADLETIGSAISVLAHDVASAGTLLAALSGDKNAQKETQGWFAAHPDVAKGAALGAVAGGLAGSVVGPVGTGVGALVGAGVGAAAGLFSSNAAAQNEATARAYFSQFYTPAQTAGILANAQTESDFNPNAANSSGHYGFFQWDQARQQAFAQWAGHPIQQSTLQEQLQFARWELTHTEKQANAALQIQSSPYGAGAAVSTLFERPADIAAEAARRGKLAEQIAAAADRAVPTSAASQPVAPAAASGDDLTTVLKRLRKQQAATQPVNVRIYNQTAAQVHVSANAAVAQ